MKHHQEKTTLVQKARQYKIADEYVEYGCGFPVRLLHVPMVKDDDEWVPDINYGKLDKLVLLELCKMPYRLTGNQVRFVRLYFEKTFEEFAEILRVKHSTIINWEKHKDESAKITWGTELTIRLFVVHQLESGATKFRQDYRELMAQKISESTSEMTLDAHLLTGLSLFVNTIF